MNPNPNSNVAEEVSDDPFTQLLAEKLLNQSDVVSSSSSGIDTAIGNAISSVSKGQQASAQRITNDFNRELDFQASEGKAAVDTHLEGRVGYGTQMVALRRLVETTDKNYKDLEMRKQDLLLQGESEAAGKIAELQLQGLQFKQRAEQDTFANLLSISNYGLSARAANLNDKQFGLQEKEFGLAKKRFGLELRSQDFAERSAMGEIALEFGLQVGENDTLDTILNKAQATGIVDERRALELESLRADIANSKAQAAKALQGEPDEEPFDEITTEILAKAALNGDTFFIEALKTNQQKQAVYGKINEMKQVDMDNLKMIASQSGSTSDFEQDAAFYFGSLGKPIDTATVAGVVASTDFNANKKPTKKVNSPFNDGKKRNQFGQIIE
jgi:hypothetical protein